MRTLSPTQINTTRRMKMPIPDELLDHLAVQYHKACIDPKRLAFINWASREAERMGFIL
jgi:hypothetical protein